MTFVSNAETKKIERRMFYSQNKETELKRLGNLVNVFDDVLNDTSNMIQLLYREYIIKQNRDGIL